MANEVEIKTPSPPAWLDKDFIQTALRTGYEDSSITVLSFDIRLANAVGDGYASDMYRITVRLQDTKQRSVVVKCHPQGGKREAAVRAWKAFQIETNMLTKTLPAMHGILEKASPGKFQPFAARCLLAGDDPCPFIVLEDLRQSGFNLAKRQQGVDLAHCTLAIKTLARFHASSMALYDQDPTAIEYYDRSLYSQRQQNFVKVFTDTSFGLLTDVVAKWPGYETYSEKLKMMKDTFYDRLVHVCERKEGAYNCLIHGDPWTTNMMFKYSEDSVTDLRLVDFQTAHYSSPSLDLQYFLHTCPSEEVRIGHMDNLIQEYHNTLTETLNTLGCTKHEISLEELWKDFEENAFFGFYAATLILPIALSDPNDGYDFENILRVEDEGYTANKIYTREHFIKAIKRLLQVFEGKGII